MVVRSGWYFFVASMPSLLCKIFPQFPGSYSAYAKNLTGVGGQWWAQGARFYDFMSLYIVCLNKFKCCTFLVGKPIMLW